MLTVMDSESETQKEIARMTNGYLMPMLQENLSK